MGIYVHVPFCAVKCAYCDFYSVARSELFSAYADALAREYRNRACECGATPVETLYFGGGTPSLLPEDIFYRITELFPLTQIHEFTIEANPDDVNERKARCWRECGVNRISLGVQSLVDSELKAVGRRHDSARALGAIDILHAAGFDNITADLIYGLPGQTADSFRYSLEMLLSTGIKHLSAYCLSYEKGTRLWLMRRRGALVEASDELIEEYYRILCSVTCRAGMEHYEISNFALPGYRSQHNSSYWSGTPYLGLGPGACSLGADGKRRNVRSDIRAYIANPNDLLEVEEESRTEKINDMIMTGLRTVEGFDTSCLLPDEYAQVIESARPHIAAGTLKASESRLYVPEARWLMCDAVIRDLFLI